MDVETNFSKSYALAKQKQFYTDPRFIVESSSSFKNFDKSFDKFVKASYDNPEGYSIRWNPLTRKKEMIIAGTRTGRDWIANLGDTLWEYSNKGSQRTPWMQKVIAKYDKIAKQQGVQVIYGHSRGGSILQDMKFNGEKFGLNAAMVMGHNKNMRNFRGGSVFDKVLGTTGKKNTYRRSNFHKVWLN